MSASCACDFVRGLRFRLTLSYVLFFTVLLVGHRLLLPADICSSKWTATCRRPLEEEWGAAKGYLHIENERPVWICGRTDPEEAYIVERLRHVYLLTDSNGNVLEHSHDLRFDRHRFAAGNRAHSAFCRSRKIHVRRDDKTAFRI